MTYISLSSELDFSQFILSKIFVIGSQILLVVAGCYFIQECTLYIFELLNAQEALVG